MASERNRVVDFLTWLPQGAVLTLLRALPYRARLATGSALLRTAVACSAGLRRRVDRNLAFIFPEKSEAERTAIRWQTADTFGRSFTETFTARAFQARAPWTEPAGPGWPALQAALAEGKGALLVGGHFGQWEAVRGALKARGIEVGALYRPLNNPWVQQVYLGNMSTHGSPMLPRGREGMKDLIRHLKRGGVVAVLLDQYVLDGDMVEFVGQPAPTGTAVAALAARYNVPMIPAYGTRQPDGVTIAIDFEVPLDPGTPEAMTQAAADSLSARIREHPGQYYWFHRRWKKKL
ncbi:MAG: lysophospholipid acyltransferase family protein [Amaricoccus sp.]|uniref:lysophospholipid acyltransferase family protein n=1 Tax=Amaricoccus sp. TaxID=1872485 RepID=UPI0039E5FE2E